MPFPWKKNRVTRISQIVADLQSPKRGGSLVVETGFPTSLIDLFVKNRSRFKKPRFKKPVRSDIPDPPPPPPSPATTPPTMPEPLLPSLPPEEPPTPSQPIEEESTERVAVPGRVGECSSGSGMTMVVVKLLVVVVLVLSVKRLTIGITVSAFALLLLEYAGKRFVSCLKPCSNASVAIESLFQKLLLLLKANEESEPATVQSGGVESRSNSLEIDEIEVLEARSDIGICSELNSLRGDMRCGFPQLVEDDDSSKGKVVEPWPCEVSESKFRGSRSGRFKSKMVKKLVPKKFRASKKEKKSKQNEAESSSEVSSGVGEDKLPCFEIEEEIEKLGKEEEDRRNRLSMSKLECIRDDEVDCGITCSQVAGEVVIVSNEEKRVDRVGNSGYTILVVITLAGLVLGRFPALILTMAWCFLLKIAKALWSSQNMPLIRCSVPKQTLDGA
ncbi:hypothetical protein SESBI_14028 [Sesbania bispinosa]|nr:hypothetical protein SESBI_14028 [Sesbania bispinosa]